MLVLAGLLVSIFALVSASAMAPALPASTKSKPVMFVPSVCAYE